MDEKELLKLTEKGETQKLEFKEKIKDGLGKSICSFANTNEGIILVGVSDKKEVIGINKKHEREIAHIAHSCKPSVYPKIENIEIEGRNIFVVEVKKSNSLHSFKNIAYKRIASHDKPLSSEEVIEFAKDSGKIKWDEQICEGASFDDIDLKAVKKFKEIYEEESKTFVRGSNSNLLKSLNCIKEVGDKVKVTNAGILLFGKEPKNFFPMSCVTVARYPGQKKEINI